MNNKTKPKFALRFLAWFCPETLYEGIEGDLLEQFDADTITVGEKKAKRKLFWNVMKFFRPGIVLRNKMSIKHNKIHMLFNHLRFTIRLFSKDKVFSALNIAGLALGIGVSMILLLIVQYDLTFDRHYINHERIYRLGADMQGPGLTMRSARTSRKLCDVLKEQFPEIEAVTRINDFGSSTGRTLVRTFIDGKEVAFNERFILRSDSDYFKVFDHEFLTGDPRTCFKDPSSAIITESTAKRFYNTSEDAIGKTFTIDGASKTWSVAGVVKDLPPNTHLKFNILLSGIERIGKFRPGIDSVNSEDFWNPDVYMYMLMPPAYDQKAFLSKWHNIHKTYFNPFGEKTASTYTPIFQSLDAIHFGPTLDADQPTGNIYYFYTICGIGILIILLASINYVNLSTAKSSKRASEIGMRKVMGSQPGTLVLLFLSESILLCLLSFFIALVFAFWVLNFSSFNDLIGRELPVALLVNPTWLTAFFGIALLIGGLSGLYPSIHLAQTPAIAALQGSYKAKQSTKIFRQGLITVQFSVSMLVVVCTLFMNEQILFLRNKDLGLDKDNIVVVHVNDNRVKNQFSVFQTELLQNPNIKATTSTQTELGENSNWYYHLMAETHTGLQHQTFSMLSVGNNFLKVMDIELVAGREPSDLENSVDFLCNETAVRVMGWGVNPLGRKIANPNGEEIGRIVGVIKDFNLNSLHSTIKPLLLVKGEDPEYLHIKISGNNIRETIRYIEKAWNKYSVSPFEYSFLDQQLDAQYRADEKQHTLVAVLSYICIFISLLGIIGLSSFTAIQRTKEIGIRKVLGADVFKIIFLLSKDTLLLVVLAALLVAPLSHWLINLWLQNFAYKTELNYLLVGVVTMAALGFVFITVFLQSYKTAAASPVKSMKYE